MFLRRLPFPNLSTNIYKADLLIIVLVISLLSLYIDNVVCYLPSFCPRCCALFNSVFFGLSSYFIIPLLMLSNVSLYKYFSCILMIMMQQGQGPYGNGSLSHFTPIIFLQMVATGFVHAIHDVLSCHDLGKAGITKAIFGIAAGSMQLGIVDGINVQARTTGTTTQTQGILRMGIFRRIFRKEGTTHATIFKASQQKQLLFVEFVCVMWYATGMRNKIRKGRTEYQMSTITMKGKATIFEQTTMNLFQKGVHGMGHEIEWCQFHHKEPGMIFAREMYFKFHLEGTFTISTKTWTKKALIVNIQKRVR